MSAGCNRTDSLDAEATRVPTCGSYDQHSQQDGTQGTLAGVPAKVKFDLDFLKDRMEARCQTHKQSGCALMREGAGWEKGWVFGRTEALVAHDGQH